MKHLLLFGFLAVSLIAAGGFGWYSYAQAQSGQNIYGDSLQGDWLNWSWGTTVNFNNNAPVHSGSSSMSVQYNHRWAGLFLHTNSVLNANEYDALRFWIHGGSEGKHRISLALVGPDNAFSNRVPVTTSQGNWTEVVIPLSEFGAIETITGIVWQDFGGGAQPIYYLDDIAFTSDGPPPPPPPAQTNIVIYDDGLTNGWSDNAWGTAADMGSNTTVQGGNNAIAVDYQQLWAALYLVNSNPVQTESGMKLSFWINGGDNGNHQLRVALTDVNGAFTGNAVALSTQANQWQLVEIDLAQLGSPATIGGIIWQDTTGQQQPPFYLDSISLVGPQAPTPVPTDVPPQPTATDVPPQPTATDVPPQPTATDQPPQPTATNQPPEPTATNQPPEPTATNEPPQPTATAVPPEPTNTPEPPPPPPANTSTFFESFDGDPGQPTSFETDNIAWTVHSRDANSWGQLPAMEAVHGPNCDAPPATHTVTNYEDTHFQCRNHMMTAINGPGYAMVYFTPNHMVDFSGNEAVIRWDMSTYRESQRDWMDVWITPFEQHNQLTLLNWLPDLNGPARNAVHIELMDIYNNFSAGIIRDYSDDRMRGSDYWVGWENWLTPDMARRDTFEIRLTRDRVIVWMPDYNRVFLDREINPPLNWSQGTVQFGHHSYNPSKSCFDNVNPNCHAGTFHWDNLEMYPTVPFTMLKADRRETSNASGADVFHFNRQSPANSFLRFTAFAGNNPEISWDGGQSWHPAQLQQTETLEGNVFWPYWTPIPAGVTQVQFRGTEPWSGGYRVRDVSIFSRTIDAATAEQSLAMAERAAEHRARPNFVNINLAGSFCTIPQNKPTEITSTADNPFAGYRNLEEPAAIDINRRVANYHGTRPDDDNDG
ncbi:MAG: hypothetical protein KDE34_03705 [Anaerolineales bacterium]|nr:hypothetical protein [Anaerolineales bacterium]